MANINKLLSNVLKNAFIKSGYGENYGNVVLCEVEGMGDFQCNDAMQLARLHKKSPMEIAESIVNNITDNEIIKDIKVAKPGFINITLNDDFLAMHIKDYLKNVDKEIKLQNVNKTVVVDFGGANVAKPLHVGHLRSAIIGESIRRIYKYMGYNTIGDVHLGDWGLQIGMVISEIKRLMPDLIYFDDKYTGPYPTNAPITIKDLETLYPNASARAKSDEEAMLEARKATFELQNKRPGYIALWRHVVDVSIKDLKSSYDRLGAHFDLWLGESDSHSYVEDMIDYISKNNFSYESEGATIIDVSLPDDKKEVPPFILIKSDGSILYSTTDLATIIKREKELDADEIIYVVDNRQEMHFTQVFRCVEKINILKKPIKLDFVGFGTMNGKDGKPYKTRDGGVMKLKDLIDEVTQKAMEKIDTQRSANMEFTQNEMENIANVVAIASLKFADLSIFRTKDYVFDVDKFSSFEGKTGPYILYTITRAKSVLAKQVEANTDSNFEFVMTQDEKQLMLALSQFGNSVLSAYESIAPSYLCDYAYKLANLFNNFYAKNNILKETDINKKLTWITITKYSLEILEKTLMLLGIETLDRM